MKHNELRVDDITIEEEAMEQEVRPKLELGHLIPDFRLQTVDGRAVSPTDFKERKNLVLVFFNPRSNEDLTVLAEAKRHYKEFLDNNAEILGIASGPVEEVDECVSSLQLPFPLLHDVREEAICAYCVVESTIFVADRYGELKMQKSLHDSPETILNDALNTLGLIEMECPECGVSSWPMYPGPSD